MGGTPLTDTTLRDLVLKRLEADTQPGDEWSALVLAALEGPEELAQLLNCKRRTIGLPHTRRREWLLEIAFAKRETFAYACEAYSRILELGKSPAERRALLSELEREPVAGAQRVDPGEYVHILREAVAARNGWKRILARCAPRANGSPARIDR